MSTMYGFAPAARREVEPGRLVATLPLEDHLRGPGGGLHGGVLTGLVDSVGGFAGGLHVLPDWVVSTSLMVSIGTTRHRGPLRFDGQLLRRGPATTVSTVAVHDDGAGGALVATALVSCAVLSPAPPGREVERPVDIPAPPTDGAPLPLEEFFRIGPDDRLAIVDRLRNVWGILDGGATSVLAATAATRAAGGGAVVDEVVHVLRPARVGPVEARCTVLGRRGADTTVRVSVHDGDRQTALASVTVRA